MLCINDELVSRVDGWRSGCNSHGYLCCVARLVIAASHSTLPIRSWTSSVALPLCRRAFYAEHRSTQTLLRLDVARQQHLRSAGCHQLFVPRHPFCLRLSGLFCGRPSGLELVTRLPARSVTFLWQFSPGPENFSFAVLLAYIAHLRLCAI